MFRSTLICTTLNEEGSIAKFIDSIANQTVFPNEVIIVDGGSSDNTAEIIKTKIKQYPKLSLKLFVKKGNRSVGRNEAIKKAGNEIILITDAGNILDKNWVKNIASPFADKAVNVVAGFYKGQPKNIFQKALIPYVLVMEDKANASEFLPATRSMALRKYVWKKLQGFDQTLSHNEDYAFALKIKEAGFNIFFQKTAIVNWFPPVNIFKTFKMFFRFALGDAQANIWRDKVLYIFLRYILAIYLLILSLIEKSWLLNAFLLISLLGYVGWSIQKNYRYVKNTQAVFYLPLLQFTSDFAVLLGTSLGLLQKLSLRKFIQLILNNKAVTAVILLYIVSMLSVIAYGVPGPSHPFDYFMDEWHQSQSVRDLFRLGTPNVPGAANGSIFHFFLSGLYLIPFYILHIINPFAIKSSVLNLAMQSRLFEIFKLNTLLFGIGSIATLGFIVKKYFKLNPFITVLLFTVTPIWLMLSNYFKYDIALVFWMLISFLFFVRYTLRPNLIDYLLAGIFTALSLSVKLLSPLPLCIIYISIFFLFTPNFKTKFKTFLVGIGASLLIYIFFANPDIILGRGSLYDYLYSNLVVTPAFNTGNFIFGMEYKWHYLTKLYPAIFGHVFYGLFLVSFIFQALILFKKIHEYKLSFKLLTEMLERNKLEILVFLTFLIFSLSLYSIKVEATNNRVIVILPFMAIMVGLFINYVSNLIKHKLIKRALTIILVILLVVQLAESFSWFPIKWSQDPRQASSFWLVNNLSKKTVLGIENVPIYQHLPDIVVKEFYLKQYKISYNANFRYKVINSRTTKLPNVLIITNDQIESRYLRQSDKKLIIDRLNKEGYKMVIQFTPDFKYFNLFNKQLDYYVSGLVQAPNTISIYEK